MWSVTAKPMNEAKIDADETMIDNDDTDKDFINSIAEVGLEDNRIRHIKKNATTGYDKRECVNFILNGEFEINLDDPKNKKAIAALKKLFQKA